MNKSMMLPRPTSPLPFVHDDLPLPPTLDGAGDPVARRVLERSRGYLGFEAAPAEASRPRLRARWARHAEEVRAAQQLRHAVFALEMGAHLRCPPGTEPGLDVDRFDAFCEHLIVTAQPGPGAPERVVGTYRLLTPGAARRAGGLYSDGEFDLSPLDSLRPGLAELGRSCTHPAWRNGAVVMLLWSALAERLQQHGLCHVVGCVSVSMRDGGGEAAALWQRLREHALCEPALRVRPWLGLPVQARAPAGPVAVPPLVRGYLKCGARLLGAPAWDPDFQVADLPMLLALSDLPAALRRRGARTLM